MAISPDAKIMKNNQLQMNLKSIFQDTFEKDDEDSLDFGNVDGYGQKSDADSFDLEPHLHIIERLSLYDRFRYEEILKQLSQAQKMKSEIDFIDFNNSQNIDELSKEKAWEVNQRYSHLISQEDLENHRVALQMQR